MIIVNMPLTKSEIDLVNHMDTIRMCKMGDNEIQVGNVSKSLAVAKLRYIQ